MITNLIFFLITLTIVIILFRYIKILKNKNKLFNCRFKISKVKYFQSVHNRKFANFSVHIKKGNSFFVDFPISFKFYSDHRFKSMIRISYSTTKNVDLEEIFNKSVEFETKTKEHVYYINDIIVGKIDIEIELLLDYGYPIIEFEILKNDLCLMTKEYKKIIKFPK